MLSREWETKLKNGLEKWNQLQEKVRPIEEWITLGEQLLGKKNEISTKSIIQLRVNKVLTVVIVISDKDSDDFMC